MRMREYPWIARDPNWGHIAQYRVVRLAVLLSRAWVEKLGYPASFLQRKGITPELESSQAALRHVESEGGESFPFALLGSKTPDEFLAELTNAARVQQGLVVDQILKKDPQSFPKLAQIARDAGAQAAQAAKARQSGHGSELPRVRAAFLALCHEAFSCGAGVGIQGVLPERVTDSKISWVDLACPHQDSLLEIGPVMDVLCDLQAAWREGFCQGWDQRLRFSRTPRAGDCCRFSMAHGEGASS
jgi:hypothetical protein